MLDGRGRLTLSIVSAAAAVLGLMLLEGAAGRCWVLGGCVGVAERRGAHILWQGLHFHLKSFSAMFVFVFFKPLILKILFKFRFTKLALQCCWSFAAMFVVYVFFKPLIIFFKNSFTKRTLQWFQFLCPCPCLIPSKLQQMIIFSMLSDARPHKSFRACFFPCVCPSRLAYLVLADVSVIFHSKAQGLLGTVIIFISKNHNIVVICLPCCLCIWGMSFSLDWQRG